MRRRRFAVERPGRPLPWGLPSITGLLCVSILLCGCEAWRGELSERDRGIVGGRLGDIPQRDLRAASTAPAVTVEQDMASMAARRTTSTTMPASAPARAGVPATQPVSITMSVADLRVQVLRNNLDLNVIALDPAIARTAISEEQAKFDAVFFGGVGYKKENPPRLDGDTVEFSSTNKDLDKQVVKMTDVEQTKDALDFDAGIEVPLPTGGKAKLRNVFEDARKLEPVSSEQYVSGLKFSLSQPLLRGAGVDANVASIRLARLNEQATSAKTRLSAIRTLALAEKVYWNLYAAGRALEIRTQQYNIAYDNLELVRRRVSQGLSPQIEIIRAEVGVTGRLETLIMAETQFRLQQRDLKRILNTPELDIDSATSVSVTSPPQLVRLVLDREPLVQAALANRMEMLELELNLAADAIRLDLARNQALPLFVIDFDYGILDRQGSLGTAWQGMWDFDNTGFAVGIRGEIPLTNEARKARVRRALLSRSQRLATRKQREIAIRQEVCDTLDVLEQNWQRVLAARQNVIVSGVNYEAELRQFREGLRTMLEVLQALTLLGDAQLKEVQAVLAYQVAQIDLAFATGTLLGYAGVGLEPVPLPIVQ